MKLSLQNLPHYIKLQHGGTRLWLCVVLPRQLRKTEELKKNREKGVGVAVICFVKLNTAMCEKIILLVLFNLL